MKTFLALRLITDRFIGADELAAWVVLNNARMGWKVDADKLATEGRCLAHSSDDPNHGSAVTYVELPDVLQALQVGDTLNPPLSMRLWSAVEALRSYQHGNSSPDLAEEVANSLVEALDGGVVAIATQDIPREAARMQLWINAQGVPPDELKQAMDDLVEEVKPR